MSDVQTVAAVAAEFFERATRSDGTAFVRLRDAAPDWIGDLVQAAHGTMFPNDWRYAAIRDAVDWIAENGGEEDAHSFADSNVDVYTGDLIAWLASHGERVCYCDDASAEFGTAPDTPITTRIAHGQYLELSEVYSSVYQSLADRADETDDPDDSPAV